MQVTQHPAKRKLGGLGLWSALIEVGGVCVIRTFLTLVERLTPVPSEVVDPLPPQCLKKYIAYARRYVHPRLSSEAALVLQKFYQELRAQHQTQA